MKFATRGRLVAAPPGLVGIAWGERRVQALASRLRPGDIAVGGAFGASGADGAVPLG